MQNEASAIVTLFCQTFWKAVSNKTTESEKQRLRIDILTLKQEVRDVLGASHTAIFLSDLKAYWHFLTQLAASTKGPLRDRLKKFKTLPPLPTSRSPFIKSLDNYARTAYQTQTTKIGRETAAFLFLAFELPNTVKVCPKKLTSVIQKRNKTRSASVSSRP